MAARRLAVVMLIWCAGCGVTKFTTTSAGGTGLPPAKDSRFCVVVPDDGRYGDIVYKGSGQLVAQRVLTALKQGGYDAQIGCSGPFRITADLILWEDRATAWSGVRDTVKVALSLFAAESQTPKKTVVYESTPNWWAASFSDWGQRQPQDLLTLEFDEAVLELVR